MVMITSVCVFERERGNLLQIWEVCTSTSTVNRSNFLDSDFKNFFQVSSKDEDFLDLSVDVEQNTSITSCLRGFSNTETLCAEHKYYCEVCCSKQEAQKRYENMISAFSVSGGIGKLLQIFNI